MQSELLKAALTHHERGWSVFPVKSGSKQPLIEWKSYQEKPASQEEIKQWWRQYPDANIGLVTGEVSGLIVLDYDDQKGEDYVRDKGIPVTPCVKTKRGKHIYFKHPGFSVQNFAKKEGLDLRGDGGFVLLPPSVHSSGVRYEWLTSPTEELATPPEWLLSLIDKKEDHPPLTQSEISEMLDGVSEGSRHATATKIAGHLIGKNLDPAEVLKLMSDWNSKNKPPLPEKEIERITTDFSQAKLQEEKEQKTKKKKQKKLKEETKTVIPGLIHLVREDGKVKYLVGDVNNLEIKETYFANETIYRPKQDLPIKMPGNDILREETDLDWHELLDEIVLFIETYLELPDKSGYLLLALWVFHTYLVEKFDKTPLLYFYGIKETGKTRAGEVLDELAFRCERLTSPTEATLFRAAHYFKGTLIIDELKLWGKDGNLEVARLIKSRYKRGLMVSRCNMENQGEDQIEYFDVFAPLVICTTESIPDIIESRCLTFLMQKNISPLVEENIDEEKSRELRNKLTIFRATFLHKELPESPPIARRRLNEILTPLYRILLLVDPERKDEFKEIVEEITKAREEEEGMTLEAEIIKEMLNYEEETTSRQFLTVEIVRRLNEDRFEKDKLSNMLVSLRIKRMGFRKIRLRNGKMGFEIDPELLEKLKLSFRITEELGGGT